MLGSCVISFGYHSANIMVQNIKHELIQMISVVFNGLLVLIFNCCFIRQFHNERGLVQIMIRSDSLKRHCNEEKQ